MNLDRLRNRHGRIWLNIGSSCYLMDDFVNVDSNWLCHLAPLFTVLKPWLKPAGREWIETYRGHRARGVRFLYANCARPLRLPAGSVDHILASHFLEHLYCDAVREVLRGFHRVCRPGGTLHVIVPDLEIRARKYVDHVLEDGAAHECVRTLHFRTEKTPHFVTRIMHALNLNHPDHGWMYDARSMHALLNETGFEVLPHNDSPSREWRREEWGQVNLLARAVK